MKFNYLKALWRFITIFLLIASGLFAYSDMLIEAWLYGIVGFIACLIDTAEFNQPEYY